MDTKGGLSRACFGYRLGGGPGVASRNYRAPTARIQARKDVDLAADDVLNRVNRCCKRQIGERVEHPPSLPIRLLENTLEELD